ncbi:hypoxanthine phosphoribosyltransferase [Flavobacterium sp. MFBS3-15]|uniref:hypoxanthine phosphoribosyltransferase n=1 Tax=Flavobacterium sp. MFBS3-15 TaxID=2989816 RepID=UPI0022359F23|nr:hypoxanthine phosphoribosyltransferase [Flavobacterium sp. MFBS3-15]MCW4468948.1 hypoxanthine phosphoribosyltransferase [Flavobacterium sp. MFBS3-15]
MIQLHDKHFVPFITAGDIDAVIKRMAAQVEADLKDETPVFIGVLNGAFMVVSDFVKHYKGNCEVSFVKMASYEGTKTTGDIKQLIGLGQNLEGRTVVIIEDIVDTGNTIVELKKMFESQNVKQLKIATLFFKPEAYTKDIALDYIGFEIPNKFIVGYGLDYDGLGRNLPEIYQLQS